MSYFFKSIAQSIGITDIIDIIVVAVIIYELLIFIRKTRAEQLIKGVVILVAAAGLADLCHLYTLFWILKGIMTFGALALVVIFQPELRRALEYIGRGRFAPSRLVSLDSERTKRIINEIVDAVIYFSQTRTGALMVIEGETSLNEIAEVGGTELDAEITTQLLESIFYEGTALHDGAVIIRNDRIMAAGCVLPLTQNKTLSKELGTRHRAGIGISENSDATVIIVSEETGLISLAKDGSLTRFLDGHDVEKALLEVYSEKGTEHLWTGMRNRMEKMGRKKDA